MVMGASRTYPWTGHKGSRFARLLYAQSPPKLGPKTAYSGGDIPAKPLPIGTCMYITS